MAEQFRTGNTFINHIGGIDLSRSTLSDWIGRCGVELEPLANALKQVVLQQRVLELDCTV
jgi:transposase